MTAMEFPSLEGALRHLQENSLFHKIKAPGQRELLK